MNCQAYISLVFEMKSRKEVMDFFENIFAVGQPCIYAGVDTITCLRWQVSLGKLFLHMHRDNWATTALAMIDACHRKATRGIPLRRLNDLWAHLGVDEEERRVFEWVAQNELPDVPVTVEKRTIEDLDALIVNY